MLGDFNRVPPYDGGPRGLPLRQCDGTRVDRIDNALTNIGRNDRYAPKITYFEQSDGRAYPQNNHYISDHPLMMLTFDANHARGVDANHARGETKN